MIYDTLFLLDKSKVFKIIEEKWGHGNKSGDRVLEINRKLKAKLGIILNEQNISKGKWLSSPNQTITDNKITGSKEDDTEHNISCDEFTLAGGEYSMEEQIQYKHEKVLNKLPLVFERLILYVYFKWMEYSSYIPDHGKDLKDLSNRHHTEKSPKKDSITSEIMESNELNQTKSKSMNKSEICSYSYNIPKLRPKPP